MASAAPTMVEQLSQRSALMGPPPIVVLLKIQGVHVYQIVAYACVPSTASNVWYKKSPTAHEA